MTILEAIVLGVLQGITEFLPVSSSGHLVLVQHFLGIKESQVFFDVMLHFGTLGAVIIVYYQLIGSLVRTGFATLFQADFYRHPRLTISNSPNLRLIWFLLLGSIPTGLIALLFKDSFEAIFGKPMVVAGMLIITGLILQLSRLGQRRRQTEIPLRTWHTLLVGIVQGLAIIPGISRSGSTISISLLLGLSPQVAAQYSFLLSIPAILGAVILKLKDVGEITIAPTVIVAGDKPNNSEIEIVDPDLEIPLRTWHTLLVGIVQGLAVIPGISRSGSTISISLLLGLSPQVAAQYSFLLSIPAILGAVILKLKDVGEITIAPTVIVAGILTSFIVGYITLRFLLAMLNRGKFSIFSYYCFALGIVAAVSIWLGA